MTLLVHIFMEISAVMGVCAIEEAGSADRTSKALQVLKQEEALLVVVVLEDAAGREEVQSGKVLLVVGDGADLQETQAAIELLLLAE